MSRGSQFTEGTIQTGSGAEGRNEPECVADSHELGISNKTLHDWLKVFG